MQGIGMFGVGFQYLGVELFGLVQVALVVIVQGAVE